ncbi:glutathione S-transferase [Acetobacter aceti NRIC 0242]|uniref:Glutathione S-transferase n=2 Tax=Acetobacter aceti TaxID=435 RepID=A0AB33II98_ACEAC|nr:glutathione S-transferase [Acetobacter aceti NBRC 14818]BCK76591.1 glutathione S-transferase [Acetobacter aceti NBRC 14818]GAN58574.1 glutathione S-transferase [Acetobacter aceti NBRC 14818]GBO81529.1 glutathione S-transferase [Acetobacter aceti NRIC 0242]
MRARLALLSSGTDCECREIKLAAKPEAMLTASPKGTVPVLVLSKDHVIDQSLDIMKWALSQSDPENWLAKPRYDLIERNDTSFKHHLDLYKYATRHNSDPHYHRQEALQSLLDLEQMLETAHFLSGAYFGLTDAAIAPFVRQFAATDSIWFEAQNIPRLQAWLREFTSSGRFEQVMHRFSPWQPTDEPVFLRADT